MIVKPPLIENHVLDRSNGSIVVGKGLLSNIEAEHAGMENSYTLQQKKSKLLKQRQVKFGAYRRVQTLEVEPRREQEIE